MKRIRRAANLRRQPSEPPRPWWAEKPKRGRPRTNFSANSTTARGYGNAHQRERARWAPLVATGGVRCVRCHEYIKPGQRWALDHADTPDAHRLGLYWGCSHQHCNNARKPPQPQQTPRAIEDFFGTAVSNKAQSEQSRPPPPACV
ncbi:hypothetical protein U8D42_04000 [Mycobacterium europaeum]|uniref:hypothetical protein n=1 Tax=Mycobacterium europaeum TaxID=761804 RepID=UPI002AE0770C|nr:hypothetical protein [Mycobacterium europaeum]MEA1159277.1 hypothetical protein [Mycobacterium europaeum]